MTESSIRALQRTLDQLVTEVRQLRAANERLVAENDSLKKQMPRSQPVERPVQTEKKENCIVFYQSYKDTIDILKFKQKSTAGVSELEDWEFTDQTLALVPLPKPVPFTIDFDPDEVKAIFYLYIVPAQRVVMDDPFAGLNFFRLMDLYKHLGGANRIPVILIPFYGSTRAPQGPYRPRMADLPDFIYSKPLMYVYVGKDNYKRPEILPLSTRVVESEDVNYSISELRRIKKRAGCD